jgi:HD-GYP domain-containing protein (c-di-GMP phosphodiesterase class II)
MNSFAVKEIEPGSYFTKPVFLDEKYLLLTPETQFDEALHERLTSWKFETIYSDGSIVSSPLAGDAEDGEDGVALSVDQDMKERALFKEAQEFFNEVLGFVERVFTHFMTKNEISERPVSEIVKRIIDMVRSHRRYLLRFGEMELKKKNYVVTHSSKTAVIAIIMGVTLKLPNHKLIELGTAALLHEIGMIRLPPHLYMSDRQLTPKERQQITAHTVLGFKTLKSASFPVSVCLGVLECRERQDGTGYPRKLTGDRISLYGKIIMVAGSFAAMTSDRPFRDALAGHAAVLQMLQQSNKMYDEQVLKALVQNVSLYPIGTYVQLANDQRGMVVDTNMDNPRAPRVKVVAGPNGERYAEQPIVDTGIETETKVVRAITAESLRAPQAEPAT